MLMVPVMRGRSVRPGRLLSDADKFHILVGVTVSLCVSYYVKMMELCPFDHSTYDIMKTYSFIELITLSEEFHCSCDKSSTSLNRSNKFIVSIKRNLYQLFQIFFNATSQPYKIRTPEQ